MKARVPVSIATVATFAALLAVSHSSASQEPVEVTLPAPAHQCASPALPLDGAPLPALSLDPAHENTFGEEAPQDAKAGVTKLHLLVNEEGRVVRARIAGSQGDARTDEWIARGVAAWRFKPRVLDGRPVCAWGAYSVAFGVVDRSPPAVPQTQAPPASQSAAPHATIDSFGTPVVQPYYAKGRMKYVRFHASCKSDENAFYTVPPGAVLTPPVHLSGGAANQLARRVPLGTEAQVFMFVNERGRVVRSVIYESSGIDGFDRGAARSAHRWRFQPATIDGKPACAWANVIVRQTRHGFH